VVCYEHAALLDGRSTTEDHHPIGRALSADTTRISGNAHRHLSDLQHDWPDVLQTARDPLTSIIAAMLADRDYSRWRAAQLDDQLDFLLRLRDRLRDHFGAVYLHALEIDDEATSTE
jgi:hypothetical protein